MTAVRALAYHDPFAAFRAFAEDEASVLLERVACGTNGAPCVLLAACPTDILRCDSFNDGASFFNRLTSFFEATRAQESMTSPCGMIGYFGYELAYFLHPLSAPKLDPRLQTPSGFLGVYDAVALYDTENRRAWILGAGARAEERADALAERLAQAPCEEFHGLGGCNVPAARAFSVPRPWEPETSREDHEARISRAIDYIHAGDIFQTNLSQRFFAHKPRGVSAYDLFLRLRRRSPAPYSAFLRCGDVSLASASPELFLRTDSRGRVVAHPIKGTRPRGSNASEDLALREALQASAKDRAENLMIVDVMRNDLARVCEVGSVRVPSLCAVETFPSVHHLVSRVEGSLCEGATPVDLLRASFPGASISGAPKIRAMEIIRELEPAPRGPYCGCFGRIGYDGAMELAMTIRTLCVHRDTVVAQAGGGIVADSVPADEYIETLVKAAPLFDTLAREW